MAIKYHYTKEILQAIRDKIASNVNTKNVLVKVDQIQDIIEKNKVFIIIEKVREVPTYEFLGTDRLVHWELQVTLELAIRGDDEDFIKEKRYEYEYIIETALFGKKEDKNLNGLITKMDISDKTYFDEPDMDLLLVGTAYTLSIDYYTKESDVSKSA